MTTNKIVLIVDDDADIRELIKILLEAEGYRVNIAADGFDALQQLRSNPPPGLIILDFMMPRLDGEEFVKRIREGRSAHVPILIMSGHSEAQKAAEELQIPYLMKPVEMEELLKTVRGLALGSRIDAA
jgi:DNA-binding response OmpR family regulator